MKKILFIIGIIAAFAIAAGIAYRVFNGWPIGFKNGWLIIYQYFCSDVCPQYGGWHKEYYNVNTKEKCAEIGGNPLIDPAWHGFIGCEPM